MPPLQEMPDTSEEVPGYLAHSNITCNQYSILLSVQFNVILHR